MSLVALVPDGRLETTVDEAWDRTPLLESILRQMERYVDHQVRAVEELDDKIEQLLAIDLLLLGLGITLLDRAVGRSLVDPGAPSLVLTGPLVVGFLAVVGSMILLIRGYVGVGSSRGPRHQAGPDPGWLAQAAEEEGWTRSHFLHGLIKGYERWAEDNENEISRIVRGRRAALVLALFGVLLYATGIFMRWHAA